MDHAAAVRILLEHRARLEPKDSDGRTALSHAAEAASLDIVMLLLEVGADATVADKYG